MNREEREEALKEINTAGSELNAQYRRWTRGKMTVLVFALLHHLSTADKCPAMLPPPQTAETILGFILGRASCASDGLMLDQIVTQETEPVQDDYETGA